MGTKTGKVIAVDFDGVISNYVKFLGEGKFADPVFGCSDFLNRLMSEGWTIIIFTTRKDTQSLRAYLAEHRIPFHKINYCEENEIQGLSDGKVLADVYLDDRAVRFRGVFDQSLYDQIQEKPWWKRV